MNLTIRQLEPSPPGLQPVEVVECKGIGHPDTICDAIAEHICVQLCRYYLDHFGFILHHNVDKILLCAGSARPAFGDGEILHPIEIYIGGRATDEFKGHRIPVHDIARAACSQWLELHLPGLQQYVRIIPRIRPGSTDLVRLFGTDPEIAVANDTSCGAGFAPLSDLEKIVLESERALNSFETKRIHPAIGADVKIMGIRQDGHIDLTVSCAFVGTLLAGVDDYVGHKEIVRRIVLDTAHSLTGLPTDAAVNAADDLPNRNLFLTVTGTSAEAGDDGEAGRGNRACGLITPYRTMTLEAAAGKNPATHVGKLYNLLACRMAEKITAMIDGVTDAQCVLVSQIGRSITDPKIVDLRLKWAEDMPPEVRHRAVAEVIEGEMERITDLRNDLLAERVRVY